MRNFSPRFALTLFRFLLNVESNGLLSVRFINEGLSMEENGKKAEALLCYEKGMHIPIVLFCNVRCSRDVIFYSLPFFKYH